MDTIYEVVDTISVETAISYNPRIAYMNMHLHGAIMPGTAYLNNVIKTSSPALRLEPPLTGKKKPSLQGRKLTHTIVQHAFLQSFSRLCRLVDAAGDGSREPSVLFYTVPNVYHAITR